MGSHPLDVRKQQILKAVVADYTRTAVPVGSHALAEYLDTWSSATIRNDLASLVDVGYLIQPHASAGRVPSDMGYRYYVDFLMDEERLSVAARRQMEPYFADLPVSLEGVLDVAAMVLALVTDSVSLVTGPRAMEVALKHVDLVALDDTHVLVMLVLEGNLIRQQPVEIDVAVDQEVLSQLATQLNRELRGSSVEGVEAHRVKSPGDNPLLDIMLGHIAAFMRSVDVRQDTLVVHDGVRNLLHQPEFGDVERLQQVLDVIEEERVLGGVLAQIASGSDVQVIIGREHGVEQLSNCSLVFTTYQVGMNRYGTMGVLGPTRLRYPEVASRVRYVARRVGEALNAILG